MKKNKNKSQGRSNLNNKRKIRRCDLNDIPLLKRLFRNVAYGGNPEHKKNPGDFGLTPPSDPRSGKSLCDVAKIFKRKLALKLLKEGISRGLISERLNEHGFPLNTWSAITMEDGTIIPLESHIENPLTGVYHGYPIPPTDPMHDEVLKRWKGSTCLISK